MKKLLLLSISLFMLSCENESESKVDFISFKSVAYHNPDVLYHSGKRTYKHVFRLNNKTSKEFNGFIDYEYKISTLDNELYLRSSKVENLPSGISEFVIYDTQLLPPNSFIEVEKVDIR